jgi:hypothetical protein
MLSPMLTVLAVGGAFFAARDRRMGDRFVLAFVCVHVATYFVFHYHSYYFLPLVPAAALLASRCLFGLGLSRRWVLLVALLLVPFVFVVSLQLLSTAKYSGPRAGEIPSLLTGAGIDPSQYVLAVHPAYWDYYGPGLEAAARAAGMGDVQGPASPDQAVASTMPVVYLAPTGLPGRELAPIQYLPVRATAPVLFGVAFRPSSGANQGYFSPGPVKPERVGSALKFGLEDREGFDGGMTLYRVSSQEILPPALPGAMLAP